MISIGLTYVAFGASVGAVAGAIGANFGLLGPFPAGGFWHRTIFGALLGAFIGVFWPLLLLT